MEEYQLYDGMEATVESYGAGTGEGNQTDDMQTSNPVVDTKYVQELNAEKLTLDHETFPHAIRLVSHGAHPFAS